MVTVSVVAFTNYRIVNNKGSLTLLEIHCCCGLTLKIIFVQGCLFSRRRFEKNKYTLFVSQVLQRSNLKDEMRSLCSAYYAKLSKGFLPIVSYALRNSEELQMLIPLVVQGYTAGECKDGQNSRVQKECNTESKLCTLSLNNLIKQKSLPA